MLPEIIFASFIGGAIHAALGIRKYNLKRGQLAAIISDGIIGAVAGVAALSLIALTGNSALLFASLSGYVGADIIGSLYKIRAKRGAFWA